MECAVENTSMQLHNKAQGQADDKFKGPQLFRAAPSLESAMPRTAPEDLRTLHDQTQTQPTQSNAAPQQYHKQVSNDLQHKI